MKAYIEERRKKTVGTWPRCGPDTYVAVQLVPDGVKPLNYLNSKIAKMRGIKIIYCGEGYSDRDKTSRSMLSQARREAEKVKGLYEQNS